MHKVAARLDRGIGTLHAGEGIQRNRFPPMVDDFLRDREHVVLVNRDADLEHLPLTVIP